MSFRWRVLGRPILNSWQISFFGSPNGTIHDKTFIKSYDHNLDVLYDVSTEQDRIIFVKTIATFMVRVFFG